jgi:hypothetical protein
VMPRAILMLALSTAMLASTWFVLGPPDIGESITFFGGGVPTLNAGEAVMGLLAWVVILVAICAVLTSVMQGAGGSPGARVVAPSIARIVVAAGLVLLVVSAVHRLLPSASICCGSGPAEIREAIRLAR